MAKNTSGGQGYARSNPSPWPPKKKEGRKAKLIKKRNSCANLGTGQHDRITKEARFLAIPNAVEREKGIGLNWGR